MASNSKATKASPGTTPGELEIETIRQLERQRAARYRVEADHGDGRPTVNRLTHGGDDPLLEALKDGKR